MKILIYQPRCSYYIGGGEVVPLEQASFFAKNKHEVTILTTKASYIKESEYFKNFKQKNKTVKILYIELDNFFRKIYDIKEGMDWKRWDIESYYVGQKAKNIIKSLELKNDVVIFHGIADTIAESNSGKSILHLHGYTETENYLHNICLYNRKNLIADSYKIQKEWAGTLKIDPSDILVKYNGINTSIFYPKKDSVKLYDFLYIGRLIEIKGIQHIIESVNISNKLGVKMSGAIAGDGPYKKILEKMVKDYNLKDQISFLGFVNENVKNYLYNSAKFSVLPSYGREGVMTTLLESSACSIPVISTKNSSMEEFIIDGYNGRLVEPKNINDLANAMKGLKMNDKLSLSLGKNALKTIVKSWEWDCVSKDLIELYEKLLSH